MNSSELMRVAGAMVARGKGILAADESTGSIKKRFDSIKLESTEEHRRTYREMLFTAPGAAEWVSGVIMFDETLRQKTKDGTPFPQYLAKQGMLPGIKVDTGAKPLAGYPGETITEGLDGLRERLVEYRGLGARFAKWRAVIDIADGIPTAFAIEANAHALARYAALCQENDIVPIVEPEVLMDGAHSIERCEQVTEAVLERVFRELFEHRVLLEGMVLKPNMVISGKKAANRAPPQAVAEATVRVLRRHVPPAVPGIAFLSGGQKRDARHRRRDMAPQHAHRGLRHGLRRRPIRGLLARDHHVGLEHHALQQHTVFEQLPEHALEHGLAHLLTALDRVCAVHEHLRLNDRHDVALLAQRRIARQSMRVRSDGECAGNSALGNIDDCAPFGEARTEPAVFDEPLAQAVEPLGDGLAAETGERLGAQVHLDTRDDPLLRQVLRERRAVPGLLADGLVVQDDAADRLGGAGGREQHFPIGAAMLLGRLQLDAIEALLDGAAALVRGEDPLAPGDHCAGNTHQLTRVHRRILHYRRRTPSGARQARGAQPC